MRGDIVRFQSIGNEVLHIRSQMRLEAPRSTYIDCYMSPRAHIEADKEFNLMHAPKLA